MINPQKQMRQKYYQTSCAQQCPVSDSHIHREDVKKVWQECREESFWYRGNIFMISIYYFRYFIFL